MAGIDIISDSTGKEIVAAIQSTDVAQARISEINAAAEAKKNEVLESIPEDYSNIVNDVSELKGDIENIDNYMGYVSQLIDTNDTNHYHKNKRWNISNITLVDSIGTSAFDIHLESGKYIAAFFGDYSCEITDGNPTLSDKIIDTKHITVNGVTTNLAMMELTSGWYAFTINDDENFKPLFVKSDNFLDIDLTKSYSIGEIVTSEIINSKKITVDINGGGDYTSFTKGLKKAMEIGDCELYVKAGIYDILEELGGSSYTENLVATSSVEGLPIGNNVKIFAEHNARLVARYKGSNRTMTDYFSVLIVVGSFELHNLYITCENIRYCVHEDIPVIDISNNGYTALYDNCTMYHVGTNSTTYIAPACIGAGCWKNSISIIKGGWYACNPEQIASPISYHNYEGTGESLVVVDNVLFAEGLGLRLYGYRPTGSIVRCRFSNSKIGRTTEIDGTASRIHLVEWNNTQYN